MQSRFGYFSGIFILIAVSLSLANCSPVGLASVQPSNYGAVALSGADSTSGGVTANITGEGATGGVTANVTGTGTTGVTANVPASGPYGGTATVWGDPHVVSANGASRELQNCNTGQWYNLLSDFGIEVNATCVPWDGNGVATVNAFSVLVGSHVINFTLPAKDIAEAGSGAWYSFEPVLTVDGVTQAIPTSTSTSLLGGMLSYEIAKLNDSEQGISASAPLLTLTQADYQIEMSFPYGGFVTITAKDAGGCASPGGFLGQTLIGGIAATGTALDPDMNATDFLVNDSTSYNSNFATCSNLAQEPSRAEHSAALL